MTRETKKTSTPHLRFPEFGEPWDEVPLNSVAVRVTDRNDDASVTRVLTNSAERGVLDQRDYFERDIATAGKLDNYFVVDKGDYVYNPRVSTIAPVGPISRNNLGKGVMSPLYTVFRFRENDTDFYEHYFRSAGWHSYLRSISSTGARHDRMSISTAAFMQMPLPNPCPAEQRKIAACLESLDDLIGAESTKLAALKSHKQGLMQQLFPRPGESHPRLRFSEFQNAGEWEEAAFGELIQINSGKGFKAAEYSDTGIQLLQIENVGYGSVKWGDSNVFLPESYSNDYPELVLREGDVVLALNRPITNGELKVAQLRKRDEPSLLYQRVGKVVRKSDLIADVYVLQLCQTFVKDFVLKKSIGSDQPFISLRELYDETVLIPKPAEQQRIAACFSSLDALLSATSRKVEALKQHKQGLMQQLFPSTQGD